MADDQVKYSDLIVDDGAIDALDKRLDDIKKKMAEVKGEAATLTAETRNLSTATREQQQATSQNAAAAENLRQRMKGLTEEQKRLEAERRKYAKLTEEEANRVKTMSGVYQQYVQAVRNGTAAQMSELKALDLQNKSYNELYQTYNALKDALNQMTVAERQNTAAGQAMTNQAKEIRDTLNNLQQATGNYALNVGNYMSAFNGLQFQTQQLLREIPSAVNVKQFFLAISNNIPMFTDALMRYNKGIPEIKVKMAGVQAEIAKLNAELATMNVQTAEYEAKLVQINALKKQEIELQGASIGGWKAILKTVGSWQTLVIVGLMLLQKLPDLVKKISERWKNAKEALTGYKNEMSASVAMTQVLADAVKKVESETTELNIIVDRLSEINSGTEEWADGIAVVNRITGANLDATNATIESVREITRAYMEQAEQLAINSLLTEKIAASNTNRKLRNQALLSNNMADLMFILGIDEKSEDYNDLSKIFEGVKLRRQELFDKIKKERPWYSNTAIESMVTDAMKMSNNTADVLFRNIIYKHLEVMSDDAIRKLQSEYGIVNPVTGDNGGNNNTKEPTEQAITEKKWEAIRARLKIEQEGYKLEQSLLKVDRDEKLENLETWQKQQHDALKQNLDNNLITQEEYDKKIAEIDQQYKDVREGIEDDYWKSSRALRSKNMKERAEEWEKNAKDNAKRELKAAVDGWAEYKAKLVEEGKTRKQIVEAEVAAEIARLNLMLKLNRDVNGEIMSDEQKAKVQEWINLLERLQQTGNYGDYKPGQFMGKGGANVTNERKRYSSTTQVVADVLGIDVTENQISDLNTVFDQAKEALNSWMDARKAAADQAKELADDEVAAAENALNREIELRNQGYANDVALREKELADAKANQKKAAEMQKKAQEDALLVNSAMEASSMAVAVANLFKDFPLYAAIPLTAVLLGSFAAAKIQAFQSIRQTKFKEGGVMLLEGGSHESGHDVNLGIGPDGSNLRAEGGEYFAVINKRSSRKYGSQIPAVVNALNSGMFEDRYIKTSDAVGLLPQVIRADNGTAVDLSSLEGGVDALVKQGEQNWTIEGDYRVLRYKNLTRRVKIG